MKSLFRAVAVASFFFLSLLVAQDAANSLDGRISDQVRMRLATDADVKGGALEVSVHDGSVVLHGRVETEKGKKKAEKIAKKIKGVKSVENDLVVGPPTSDR